jgi:hypothetical protein
MKELIVAFDLSKAAVRAAAQLGLRHAIGSAHPGCAQGGRCEQMHEFVFLTDSDWLKASGFARTSATSVLTCI